MNLAQQAAHMITSIFYQSTLIELTELPSVETLLLFTHASIQFFWCLPATAAMRGIVVQVLAISYIILCAINMAEGK